MQYNIVILSHNNNKKKIKIQNCFFYKISIKIRIYKQYWNSIFLLKQFCDIPFFISLYLYVQNKLGSSIPVRSPHIHLRKHSQGSYDTLPEHYSWVILHYSREQECSKEAGRWVRIAMDFPHTFTPRTRS